MAEADCDNLVVDADWGQAPCFGLKRGFGVSKLLVEETHGDS